MAEIKKTLNYMLKIAWKKKPEVLMIYAGMLISTVVVKYASIFLPKMVIDQVAKIIEDGFAKEYVYKALMYIGMLILLTFLMNLLSGICLHAKKIYKEWFDGYFEILLAERAMRMDYEHTENPEALNQMTKAKEGISWYSGGVVGVLDAMYEILVNIIVLSGVFFIITVACPVLLPIQVGSLAIMYYFFSKINKLKVEQFKRLSKSNRMCSYVFYQLSDIVYGKDIRLYDSAEMMKEKSKKYADQRIDEWKTLGRMQRKNSWVIDVSNAIRDGLTYLYIGWMAIKNRITIGEFSMYVSSASTFYQSLANLASGWQEIVKKCNYVYQFILFMNYDEAMPNGKECIKGDKHEIEFRHVNFRYPKSDKLILKDINIKIYSGEHLSIVGLNGAGKTTFIKLLCRLYDVTEGQILVDGKDIREYSKEEYRSLFGTIFQDFKLFAFSLKDNILAGAEEDAVKLERVIRLSGLDNDVQRLDKGVETLLYKSFEEDGTELSGGQQQKVAIARALYKDMPVMIMDEPTAALDPKAEYDIYRQFDKITENKTAIYISHRLSSCKFCDKIAVFADNTIKEYGSHEELLKRKNGIYAELFKTQAQYYND